MRVFIFMLINLGLAFGLGACAPKTPDTKPAPPASENANAAKTWKLDGAQSSLEFISVKNGAIIETHSFTNLSGAVLADGGAVVLIKLDSVQTNIDIRNERMKKYLFETDKLQNIMVKTQINLSKLSALPMGHRAEMDIPVTISMHGKTDTIDVPMIITHLSENTVVVDSRSPVILDADTFGYGPGIDKLQELAKLNSIAHDIPVMFSLVFAQE